MSDRQFALAAFRTLIACLPGSGATYLPEFVWLVASAGAPWVPPLPSFWAFQVAHRLSMGLFLVMAMCGVIAL